MRRVLVIDDDACVLWALSMGLQRANFDVTTCNSSWEAVTAAENTRPDLVICDIMMPGMDGYAVLVAFRAHASLRHLPFLFLTGKESMTDVRAGMDFGADDYLPKSASIDEILRAIKTRLGRVERLQLDSQSPEAEGERPETVCDSMGLSRRESEVMHWVIEGKTNEEIGIILGISKSTVRTHLQNIFPKLGVENRVAAAQAIRRGQLGESAPANLTPDRTASRTSWEREHVHVGS